MVIQFESKSENYLPQPGLLYFFPMTTGITVYLFL